MDSRGFYKLLNREKRERRENGELALRIIYHFFAFLACFGATEQGFLH